MTWAQLQARTNAAVLAVFGNTPGVLGWEDVQGDFVEPSDEVFLGGVSAMARVPQYVMLSSAVPAQVVGMPLCLTPPGETDARTYKVARAQPDGLGMTTLLLEREL